MDKADETRTAEVVEGSTPGDVGRPAREVERELYDVDDPSGLDRREVSDIRDDVEELVDNDGDMNYMADDSTEERDGGILPTPITERYERIAQRDELARKLEEVVADAREWVETSEDEDARSIYEDLVDIFERVGEPLEDTDD